MRASLATKRLVMLKHRERVEASQSFEEFKKTQLMLIDYVIADLDHKADEGFTTFIEERTS